MNISQGLKRKNKLANDIKSLQIKINKYNSTLVGNEFEYDVDSLKKELDKKVIEIIDLKTAIHIASAPMRRTIFELSELKSLLIFYKEVPCLKGKQTLGRYSNEAQDHICQIEKKEMDKIVSETIDKIELLQDHLDVFNATTEVNI